MKKIIIFASVFLLMTAPCFARTYGRQNYPMTVKDDWGVSLRQTKPPERIVSCMPSVTEMLYDLGLGDRVVGVTENCNYPDEARKKEKVGRVKMNTEKIISLKPDLIVMLGSAQEEEIKRFRSLGLPVFVVDPKNVEDIMSSYVKLGVATNRPHVANQISGRMQRSLRWTGTRIENEKKKKPRVFIQILHKPLMTASKDTFIQSVLDSAGAENIACFARGKYPEYSIETLIKQDPDAIIIFNQNVKSEKEIYNDLKWQRLTAVKQRRVLFIDADIVTRPTSRIRNAVAQIADFIYLFGEENED